MDTEKILLLPLPHLVNQMWPTQELIQSSPPEVMTFQGPWTFLLHFGGLPTILQRTNQMYLVWVPVKTPLLQSKSYQIFTSVIFIFKVPSSQMRQAGLMNLSIWEEREEESREAVPVLWFNQHGPRVKGKFHVPNLAFRRDGMISQVEQSGELGGGWEEERKSQSLVGGDRTLRCLQTETCESTYQCASIRLL